MRKGNGNSCAGLLAGKITAILTVALILITYGSGIAANSVDIRITGIDTDTLRITTPVSYDIWIENDYVLGGMHLGFRIFSPDGVWWEWQPLGSHGASLIVSSGYGRMGDGSVFDITGLIVGEVNIDGISPDTILCTGVASSIGLPIGPLEHMYSMHFEPLAECDEYPPRTICIDSTFVPPSGHFVFVNAQGSGMPPMTLWPSGGWCLPVAFPRNFLPDWDPGLPTSMTVECGSTGSVILSATDPELDDVIFGRLELTGGGGEATLTDHGEGTCEVFYTPVIEDIGQEITIGVRVADYHGLVVACPPYIINVDVVNKPLTMECGFGYINGATENPMAKTDMFVEDDTLYGDLVYSLISGPGEVDPETGEWTWTPGPSDTGIFQVVIGVTDGVLVDECSFQVDVVDQSCCPGDANFSGDVNVGDAVMLIAYIFNEGPAPQVPNWADANADCVINVGDVVYLIAYIFNLGPAPQLGCVY